MPGRRQGWAVSEVPTRRVAWITGAGKGIGRGLAKRLAEDGWTVCASARTVADLESLAAACPDGHLHPHVLDITDPSATRAVLTAIEAEWGPPDLAVLNAGNHIPVTAADLDAEPFRRLMETNVMGTVYGLTNLLPIMRRRGSGHIAVVSSLAGYRGLPTSAAYGASKAALINMCEALRPELDAMGIKLQVITPGFVETPLTDQNDFEMPFLVTVDEATDQIMRGLASDRFEVSFPRIFSLIMKGLRILPDPLFFAMTRRMIKP